MAHENRAVASRHGVGGLESYVATLYDTAVFIRGSDTLLTRPSRSECRDLPSSRNVAPKQQARRAVSVSSATTEQLSRFFEKLEKKKNAAFTLSKLFGSHPPTPDRIVKVPIACGGSRCDDTRSSSEFNRVKGGSGDHQLEDA